MHEIVRKWVAEKLKESGDPQDPRSRDRVLLEAVRSVSPWRPDPWVPPASIRSAFGDCTPEWRDEPRKLHLMVGHWDGERWILIDEPYDRPFSDLFVKRLIEEEQARRLSIATWENEGGALR